MASLACLVPMCFKFWAEVLCGCIQHVRLWYVSLHVLIVMVIVQQPWGIPTCLGCSSKGVYKHSGAGVSRRACMCS